MSEIIKPQPKQQEFLSNPADIVIYGGAAGGGKSWSLLYEALRWIHIPAFRATIFRRNMTQIMNAGGLWDASLNLYSKVPGAIPRKTPKPKWLFPSGAEISFAHLEYDSDVYSFQGAEIALIEFDEATHFTEKQFWYMLSRNRSTCGIRPYIRASTNPDPDSWLCKMLEWWINPNTGYAIPERSGKIRWFIRRDGVLTWADKKEELIELFNLKTPEEKMEPKSFSFVASSLFDNQILMKADPGYYSNLKALPLVQQEQLLYGNWKIRPAAGLFFKRTQIGDIITVIPDDVVRWVRAWDLAATAEEESGDAAYTSGVLMGKRKNGRYIIANVINVRQTAAEVRKTIKMTAITDKAWFGNRVRIRLPQDPGQAGKAQAQSYIKYLAGYDVKAVPESGSKEVRAEPMAAQWQAGNFDVYLDDWNEMYFNQMESFPSSKYKDMVDASSSAFAELELENIFDLSSLID